MIHPYWLGECDDGAHGEEIMRQSRRCLLIGVLSCVALSSPNPMTLAKPPSLDERIEQRVQARWLEFLEAETKAEAERIAEAVKPLKTAQRDLADQVDRIERDQVWVEDSARPRLDEFDERLIKRTGEVATLGLKISEVKSIRRLLLST